MLEFRTAPACALSQSSLASRRRSRRFWFSQTDRAKYCQAWYLDAQRISSCEYSSVLQPSSWTETWRYLLSASFSFAHSWANLHLDTVPWQSKYAYWSQMNHTSSQRCHGHSASRWPSPASRVASALFHSGEPSSQLTWWQPNVPKSCDTPSWLFQKLLVPALDQFCKIHTSKSS